jgi:CubicO group peptidase (beta-lactamase class C family)
MKLKNKVFLFAALLIGTLLITGLSYQKKLYRLHKSMTLFDKEVITENFRSLPDFFASKTIHKASQPFHFPTAGPIALPKTFDYNKMTFNTSDHLRDTMTTGFLIIQNDQILLEQYHLGNTPEATNISWSMGKSVVSALFGIAIAEGHIDNIEQTVTDYVPELVNTGYDGVRIKDVLQMSSGVAFNEDYSDFASDINRFSRTLALGGSLDAFTASLKRESEPGTFNHYVSINTQVLGMILVRATGISLSQYLQEKIWNKIGTESDAYWLTDDAGMELALGGLNVTLRDYARIGRLYLHNGNWNGEQIIPAQWVKDSVTPDAPHLLPGPNPQSDSVFGYGYQWWIPEQPQGDFMAIGIYNQFIYVHPENDLIIVKLSANHRYTDAGDISDPQTAAMFQTIAESLSKTR